MKNIFCLVICFFILGCASGTWTTVNYTSINPNPGGPIKNYTLGERKTAFIGQEIIKVEICDKFQKTVMSERDIIADAKYKFKNYHITHNQINQQYPLYGVIIHDNQKYYLTEGYDGVYKWGVLISENGDIYQGGLYSYEYQMLYFSNSIVVTPSHLNHSTSCVRITPYAISYELIFSGKK